MAEVISRRSIVYDISFDAKGARQGAQQTEKALKDVNKAAGDVGSSFTNLGKQIAGAFALEAVVRQIGQFTREAFELGLKAEGVKRAFQNLNDPKLLDNLRKATKGTVDDFVLMQSAVKADKFKIPLTQLATLFDFARRRAKETGQEVGFLTESIIDGIGKQSTPILDNLGLRAQDLQKEFSRTGDFAKAAANVINEEMRTSGEEIETNAEKVERLRTSWQNFKLDVGDALVGSIDEAEAFLTGPISGNKKIFDAIFNLAADNVGIVDQLRKKWAAQAEEARRAGEQMNAAQAGQNIFASLANVALNTTAFSLEEINMRLKELNEEFEKATDPRIQQGLAIQIQSFQKMQKAIVDLLTAAPAGTIKALEKQLADIAEQMQVTDPESLLFAQLSRQSETLTIRLDALKKKFDNIVFTIKTAAIETSFQKTANELYNIGQALDDVTQDARIAATEFIEMADGTMIKGLQENTVKGMREILEEQRAIAAEARTTIIDSSAQIFGDLSSMMAEGSQAQMAFSIANILASNAEALANAIKSALNLPYPANIAAAVSSIALVTSMFAQVNSLLSKAKGAGSSANATAFAEGEVDIHRPGETRGKDSIPAIIMPGESVLTAKATREHKPLIQAIHDGTVDEMIMLNYVEPALALNALKSSKEDSAQAIDYSDKFYRQYLATGEGNLNSKRMLRVLASIDQKLTTKPSRYSR